MKIKTMFIFSLLLSQLFAVDIGRTDCYAKDPGHRQLLRDHFDTTYWKAFWEDDIWHIRCMFVDLDRDGLEEMIAITTSDEDPMGDYWEIWRQDKGEMKKIQFCGNLFYWCHQDSFFKMVFDNGDQKLIGLGMRAGYVKGEFNEIIKPTPDCVFQVGENSYELRELAPDVDSVFMGNGPRCIERLHPEWYFGYDFNPPKDIPHNPYLERPPYTKPKGDLRFGGGIGEPSGFAAFVERYRCAKKAKASGGVNVVPVHAVFLDADNDGDADFYITSDLDNLEDGNYAWDLYLQRNGGFFPTKETVHPAPARKVLHGLPSSAIASKSSFCRIVRLDVAPIFLIVDRTRKNQIRDAVRDVNAHRVEKLLCRTYPDAPKP